MIRWLLLLGALTLTSCKGAEGRELSSDPVLPQNIEAANLEDTASFEEVLAQYQALNQRLESVSYNLQSANAALCGVTDRSAGLTVHTIYDYPNDLQPYARGLLGVDNGLSLRTIRAGSSAAKAGLLPGDQLVKMDGVYLPSGRTAKTLYEALERRTLKEDTVSITVRRDEGLSTHMLTPETICGYPVNLFFSEQINGHTDGEEVWITSELLRSVPDDVDLALVIAHEMAHAIAGHMALPPTKELELEADRMALIMLARAGYNIGQAIENWAIAPHPDETDFPSVTHPTQAERFENFNTVQRRIKAQLSRNQTLTFED